MPAKKKATKKRTVVTAKYKCPPGNPIPTGACAKASLPHNVPQLTAELEAYLKCLCAWQQKVADVVNKCCASGGGPDFVPPPPPPPF